MRATLKLILSLAAVSPCTAFAQPAVRPITVVISLSPQASTRLAALHEGIIVSAMFSGDPATRAGRRLDERGQIGLATEDVTIPGAPGTATITGAGVTEAKLHQLRDRNVHLLINVFSARHAVADNVLLCDLFDDSAALAARAPVRIGCKLITEGF